MSLWVVSDAEKIVWRELRFVVWFYWSSVSSMYFFIRLLSRRSVLGNIFAYTVQWEQLHPWMNFLCGRISENSSENTKHKSQTHNKYSFCTQFLLRAVRWNGETTLATERKVAGSVTGTMNTAAKSVRPALAHPFLLSLLKCSLTRSAAVELLQWWTEVNCGGTGQLPGVTAQQGVPGKQHSCSVN